MRPDHTIMLLTFSEKEGQSAEGDKKKERSERDVQ